MYRLEFTKRSINDLDKLQRYLHINFSARNAEDCVESIICFCQTLQHAPLRGEERPSLRPGLRTIGFKGRVSVLFSIADSQRVVRIIRILYAGKQPTGRYRRQS